MSSMAEDYVADEVHGRTDSSWQSMQILMAEIFMAEALMAEEACGRADRKGREKVTHKVSHNGSRVIASRKIFRSQPSIG